MVVLSEVKACLRAVEEGCFENIDLSLFKENFAKDAARLGDYLQYALHKFCKESQEKKLENSVIELAILCYSEESVMGFKNMVRFMGSLSFICKYLLSKKMYNAALQIITSVDYKKLDIEKSALEDKSIVDFLYILHSHFILAAQEVASEIKDCTGYNLCCNLAETSLKFMNLIKSKQLELGRKLLRNFNNYFNKLKHCINKNVCDLYKNLEYTLTNVLPIYNEKDFLLYYIIKTDVPERLEDDIIQLKSYFKEHIKVISSLLGDDKHLKYLNLILDFLFDKMNKSKNEQVSSAMKMLSTTTNHKFYFLILQIILDHATRLHIYAFTSSELVPATYVRILFNSVMRLLKSYLGDQSKFCRSSEYQTEICFSDRFVNIALRILHIIRLSVKQGPIECLDLINISRESFQMVKACFAEMRNDCCRTRKKQCWNNLIIHYTNTVESLLKHYTEKSWLLIRDCSEELICELINGEFDIPYERRRIAILFQRWHYANMKLKNYKEALFVCAFYLLSYPENEEEAYSMWAQTKMSMCSEPFLTIKDVIGEQSERIMCMNPKCKISQEDTKNLLMKELILSYGSCSGFKNAETHTQFFLKMWDTLKILDLNNWERANLLSHIVIATVSYLEPSTLKMFIGESQYVIKSLPKTKGKKNVRSLLYGASLKYSLFLCRLKSIQESEEDLNVSSCVLEYLKKEEEEKVKFGEMADMNLTCDVMPSSRNFAVTFEESYIKALNETFSLWEEAAASLTINCLKPYEFVSWLHNIKQISQMYFLIGDVHQSYLSWTLYYKIAKICNNRAGMLLGLSRIIPECVNIKHSTIESEANEIANELIESNKDKDIVIEYWLAVAHNYLKNMDDFNCFALLCKAKEAIESLKRDLKSYLFQARFWCLAGKFLCLYHSYMERLQMKPDTDLRTVAFRAFNYVNAALKGEHFGAVRHSDFCDILITMLDVNIWAYQLFGVYYQAGYMRLFLEDMYQIFQKLVLPTRTAFILLLLAEVDVLCEKIRDLSTKLNSLKGILGSSLNFCIEESFEKKTTNLLEVPVLATREGGSPRQLSPARFIDISESSIEGEVSPMKYVIAQANEKNNSNHNEKCTCYTCRSIIIQFLNVGALYLEAELNKLMGSMKKSYMFYCDCYKNLKKLECFRLEFNSKLISAMSKSKCNFNCKLDFQKDLVQINSVKMLSNYALFLLSPTLKGCGRDNVDNLIVKIDKIMDGLSYYVKLLDWRVMELKLAKITVSEAIRQQDDYFEEKATVIASPVPSPEHSVVDTPIASKLCFEKCKPIKYKQPLKNKSPNLFICKAPGRRIFDSDIDVESQVATETGSRNNMVECEDVEIKMENKRTLRKKPVK